MLFALFFNVEITSASLSAYLLGAFTIINIMGTRDITWHDKSSQLRGTVNHMFGLNSRLEEPEKCRRLGAWTDTELLNDSLL